MSRSGSPYSTPRDANRVPFLTAASTADGVTPVVLEADPTTHLLQVSSSGGGGGTQYTDGSATIAHPIGTIPVYDKAGTITSVSVANPLPVSASITPTSDTTQTGSITGSGQSVTFAVNAQSTVGIQASGTFSGTILIKGSVDGSTYTPTTATSLSTGGTVSTITSSFTGQVNVAGFVSFQLTSVSWTSGTANISLRASTGISNIMLDNPLPVGTNSIGNVGLNAGTNAIGSITNTSFTATQATGTNLHTVVDSGAVTANIGTTNGLALDATLTGGTQQSKITDGTNIASVVAGDTGFNGTAIASGTKTIAITTSGTGAQTIGPFDVRGYQTIEVVWTVNGTGLTLTGAQWSPTSGGTFQTASTFTTGINAPSNALGTVINTVYKSQIWGNYFQIAVSALTSGTATGYITLRNMPLYTSTVSANITATNNTTSTIPTSALPVGFKALSADQTATTTTYNTQGIVDLVGKQVVMPYSINQQFVKGTGNATGTASTSLITAVASNSIYLTSVQVMNTGTVTSQILLQDGNAGTTLAYAQAPAGGGSNITFPVPIKNTSGNAWYFAAGSASSTIYVSAQGYYGV